MKNKRILVVLYSHPEYYPPTLNAIDCLAKSFSEVRVVHRPFLDNTWSFAKNVKLISSGKRIDVKEQEKASTLLKALYHFQFYFAVCKELVNFKYHAILAYDHLSTFSLYLSQFLIRKNTVLWYHNHDVALNNETRKFSIGNLAIKTQNMLLKKCNIFSLPTKERQQYFDVHIKPKKFIIPNYPSLKKYREFDFLNKSIEEPRIIYQGTIGDGRGIYEISKAIHDSDQLKNVHLTLIGRMDPELKAKLKSEKVITKVDIKGYIPYKALLYHTMQCHIGLAVFKPTNIVFQTASFASNKIYEYAACGLPILYYDIPDHNYLSDFKWAFATDLTESSIENCITEIMNNYSYYSKLARESFLRKFNFEIHFDKVIRYIEDDLIR